MPSAEHQPSPLRFDFVKQILAFLLLLASSGLGLEMTWWPHDAPLIWPPMGIGLFFVLVGGWRFLPGIFLAALVSRYMAHGNVVESMVFGVAYGGVATLMLFLLKHLLDFDTALERLRDVALFTLMGVGLGPLFTSMLTTGVISMESGYELSRFSQLLGLRWLGDALGALVIAPFLLVWASNTRINWRNNQSVEVLLWMLMMLVVGVLVFRNWAPTDTLRYPLELAMFPLMAWGAIRFGQRGVVVGILLASLMAIWELREVIGPDPSRTISQPPGYLWGFLGVLSLTALFLAATWTELRKREEEVSTNEERLRAFINALPDLAFVFDVSGTCTDIFAPPDSLLRSRFHALKGKPLENVFPVDLASTFREYFKEVIESNQMKIVRYAVAIDGIDRTFEGRFVPIQAVSELPPSIMVISYDLTENQRARSDLQKRDLMLKTLTEAEAILLKEKNYDRGIRSTMDRVAIGLSLDIIQIYQSLGKDLNVLGLQCAFEWSVESPMVEGSFHVTPADLRDIDPKWKDHLLNGVGWVLNYSGSPGPCRDLLDRMGLRTLVLHGIYPDGGDPGIILYGSAEEWGDSNLYQFPILMAISESIRSYMETRIIQDELQAAKEAAVAADHAKSEFLAIMSHEIRTPMNAIIGFSDLLRQTPTNPRQQDYIDIIARSGKDLLELINNILDFSKLESDNVELERIEFNLETQLIEVMEMVLYRAKEKGIALDYDGDKLIRATYWGDPLRLRQVVLNLLANAVKFTEKGSVKLEARIAEEDGLWCLIRFDVIDTGIGIPDSQRGELFKAFRQADSSTTRQFGGTGLGLTIVQRLVDKMGGRIEVESAVGVGSTFSVFLPLERKEAGTIAAGSPVATNERLETTFAAEFPLKILVVEDDPVNTRLICEILRRLGYHPESVVDGFKALEALRLSPFDFILMDMQMSHMDGVETTVLIRSGECGDAVRNIAIAALTALALQDERERIMKCGVDYYLPKPIQLEALKGVLKEASGRCHPEA